MNGSLQKKHLLKFTQIIKKNIHIHHFNNQQKEREAKYGDYKETVHVALYEGHYFIHEPVDFITLYASKNYRKVIEHKKNPFKITGISKYVKREKVKKPISSLSCQSRH